MIKENKKEIQANLLNKIIQPTITKKEEQIRNNLSTLGVVFDKPIYKVLLLTIEDFLFLTKGRLEEEKLEILQRINDIIENAFFHGVHIESFINKYGQFVIIMNGESISKLYLEDCCPKITNKVLEEGFQCIFSCGTEKNAFSQVYISYQEAVSALHQHICQKGQNIIYFNGNIIEDNWMFEEVKQEEQLILEYMQSYDEEGMIQCMDRIFQKAVIEKQTFKSIQATCTKLIALLIAQLEEMLALKEEVPLNIQSSIERMKFEGDYTTLATITLPYTMTGTSEFSSIHSNPPGVSTDDPAAIIKKVGKGKILWTSAPIEDSKPYMSKKVVGKMVELLRGEKEIEVNAPACIEVLKWTKENKIYLGVLNEQEKSPFIPVSNVKIKLNENIKKAVCVSTGEEISVEYEDGKTVLTIPEIQVFSLVEPIC